MANIQRKKDGRIAVRYKIDGESFYEALGRGPAAEELAKRRVAELDSMKRRGPVPDGSASMPCAACTWKAESTWAQPIR